MPAGGKRQGDGAVPAAGRASISMRVLYGLAAAAREFQPRRTTATALPLPDLELPPGHRLTFREFAQRLTGYGRQLRDEALGLMAEPLSLGTFHMLTEAVIGEPDLYRMWRKFARFSGLVTDAYPLAVSEHDDRVLIRWVGIDTSICHPLFVFVQLLFMQRLSAWMIGRPAIEGTLHVTAWILPYLDDWAPLVWGRPEHADFIGFSIPRQTAQLPNIQDHQTLTAIMRRPAEYMLFVEETPRLSERVRRILVMRPGEITSMEAVCDSLNMHSRTLMRRLADEGIRFVDLRATVKCEAACRLLTRSNLPIAEIAGQLGFAEPASFIRLFKRQMGVAPSTFRREAAITGQW